ncbi:hypothetical protein AUJ68_03250 [Candidatus Woesearchaeota archaeon CG1_02_57_44]|nr:MAG: hypothetical protein AUJ68_03250 [Candidatus Woesearchaeota archaeon CG1_02_57_44]
MHEMAFVNKIISEASHHGAIKEVHLEIGELAHVPGQDIVDTLTRIVDWKVSWTEKPAQCKCRCGYRGPPRILDRGHDHFLIECPPCGAVPELTDGTDIVIKSVDVKDGDE